MYLILHQITLSLDISGVETRKESEPSPLPCTAWEHFRKETELLVAKLVPALLVVKSKMHFLSRSLHQSAEIKGPEADAGTFTEKTPPKTVSCPA
ncbi:hypothetical protein MHYP_G00107100 [Metynnis hypsauchen]